MRKILIVSGILLFSISLVCAEQHDDVFVYDSKGKRDPFLSLVSPEGFLINIEPFSETSEVNIEGIFFDPKGSSFAIINSEVVKSGDTIGGFEVLEIKKNKVILIKNAERFEIELKEGK